MSLLESISTPADLRGLDRDQLVGLAAELRTFLVESVGVTGGHLGPNLGVVELTLALHRVFDSPRDRLLWDTGHQAYVHKLLTGRREGFARLRQSGGLSGYPSREESAHDSVENSHASTALAYADGLVRAFELSGETDRAVVAVVGDGAMTGGMCWEALNNLGAAPARPVVVVLNDNGRSYAPTAGALADHLSTLRSRAGYADVVGSLRGGPGPAGAADSSVFTNLGFAYLGPVDGHDIEALERALEQARALRRPVVLHAVTSKGHGFPAAETEPLDRMHAVPPRDPRTGAGPSKGAAGAQPPAAAPAAPSWTSVFGAELARLAGAREDVVAITAAMMEPTGLMPFAERHPERVFDVGIAEQHAMTMAAGLAMGGVHPVVAIYATFLGRAVDQTLMDVGLHRLPVTLVLDRAGITGPDGPSHHGVWDLSVLQLIPGMRVAAPRDAGTLRLALGEALDVDDGPTAIRFPKGSVGQAIPAEDQVGGIDVLGSDERSDVLLVAVGAMASTCLDVAEMLRNRGVGVTVVDPRWVLPVNPALAWLASSHRLVVTVEDNSEAGGIGTGVARVLRRHGVDVPIRTLGVPREFLPHGSRSEILAACGLSAPAVAADVLDVLEDRCVRELSSRPTTARGWRRLVPVHRPGGTAVRGSGRAG